MQFKYTYAKYPFVKLLLLLAIATMPSGQTISTVNMILVI
jgi:hypothetical protein